MTGVILLGAAVLCVSGKCYPALVGRDTPSGTYPVIRRYVDSPGYGGDVLEFKETADSVFAIHRVWTLRPQEHRVERLQSGDVKQRRNITGGCVNVMPDVYEQLKGLDSVEIKP